MGLSHADIVLGVFTALCVMLAFNLLSSESKANAGFLDSINTDEDIARGTKLLREVGEHCHPLASRYLQWFQKLQSKLPTLSIEITDNSTQDLLRGGTSSSDQPTSYGRPLTVPPEPVDNRHASDERRFDESLLVSSEELFEIENMFFSTGWADWVDTGN